MHVPGSFLIRLTPSLKRKVLQIPVCAYIHLQKLSFEWVDSSPNLGLCPTFYARFIVVPGVLKKLDRATVKCIESTWVVMIRGAQQVERRSRGFLVGLT